MCFEYVENTALLGKFLNVIFQILGTFSTLTTLNRRNGLFLTQDCQAQEGLNELHFQFCPIHPTLGKQGNLNM